LKIITFKTESIRLSNFTHYYKILSLNHLVSVIIPTCNRSKLLIKTIQSVLNQTFNNYELLIVDDGSIDETKTSVNKIISENPHSKIKYIYQENEGVYSAINNGLTNSKGKYVAILDSDDKWYPNFLEVMVEELTRREDVGLVYCGSIRFSNEQGEVRRSDFRYSKEGNLLKYMVFRKHHIYYGTCLFRKECFDKVGYYDSFFRTLGDREFHYRFSKKYNYGLVKKYLVLIRVHSESNKLIGFGPENNQISFEEQIRKYEKYWIRKMLADEFIINSFIFAKRRIISAFLYSFGKMYYDRGVLDKSYNFLKIAIILFPFNFKAIYYLLLNYLGIYDKAYAKKINEIESHLG